MFGPRIHPDCFKSVLLLEDGVGDDKLLLSAKLQQQVPVVLAVTNAVCAKYAFPGICISASIEITKDYQLVVFRGTLETAAELRVELVFFCSFSSKYLSVPTEKRGIPLILQSKAHGHHLVGLTSCQIFQPGEDGCADSKTDAWKAPLCCRFPWSEKEVSRAMLLVAVVSWKVDLAKDSNIDI